MPSKSTQEQFINKANLKHNNYYDYSLVKYISAKIKVKIICPKHGEFEQQPSNHLFGQRCIKCMGDNVRESIKIKINEWINRFRKIHGNKYDYSLVKEFKGNSINSNIIIICPKHGEFLQTPQNHLKNNCPYCNISKGEDEIEKFLIKNKINYKREHKFKDCLNPKSNRLLPFDFYLPDYNLCIEYQGEQHFKITKFFEKRAGGLEGLKYRDKIKKQYCLENNIGLLEILYTDFDKIKLILNEKFKL
jgi:formylmethanofuran dehydrogenase subunit E